MPFPGPGPGRPKGSKNKLTHLKEALEAKGLDFAQMWVEVLTHPKEEIRHKALFEVTPYVAPKLSSMALDATVAEKMAEYEKMTLQEKIDLHRKEADALEAKMG